MTIHTVGQRSPEWFALRAGRVTGTTAADMLAAIKKGEAAARRDLRMRLVCERLTGQPADNGGGYQSADMRWGVEHERAARMAYEARTGDLVRAVGFVTHDTLAAGCSPDGIVGDGVGLIEIKCPKSATHFGIWQTNTIPPEYVPQLQHNLWITGCRWSR